MPAYDYAILPRAPEAPSYAAPLLGFALGNQIANLPNQYMAGREQGRTIAAEDAFKDGSPLTAATIMQKGAQLGGLPWATPLLKTFLEIQAGDQNARAMQNLDSAATGNTGPTSNPSATGPANLAPPQPRLSSAGTDNNGADTVRSLTSEAFGDQDMTPVIPRWAAAMGVDPDQPLSAEQALQAKQLMGRTKLAMAGGGGQPATDAAPIGMAGARDGAPGGLPTQGASGAPGPAPEPPATTMQPGTQPPAQVAQVQPAMDQGRPQQGPGAAPQSQETIANQPSYVAQGLVPPGADPRAYADNLRRYSANARAAAARVAPFNAATATQWEKQADAYDQRAKAIDEAIGKERELTPEQKNARASGAGTPLQFEARKEEQKGEIAQSQKTYNGMQAASTQYERDLKPYLDISRSVLNAPGMYTGTGANLVLDVNRIRAAFGDTAPAMMQEALQKVTASSVLAQINTQRDQLMEAGGTAGRIFAQQVSLVEKAAPALSNTLGGNRFLVEVASRMGELSTQVTQMARDYITKHGHLDPQFDRQLSDYMKAHPVFNKQEMTHPELLGAATLPPNVQGKDAVAAWGRSVGLTPGAPIRLPDGRYVATP